MSSNLTNFLFLIRQMLPYAKVKRAKLLEYPKENAFRSSVSWTRTRKKYRFGGIWLPLDKWYRCHHLDSRCKGLRVFYTMRQFLTWTTEVYSAGEKIKLGYRALPVSFLLLLQVRQTFSTFSSYRQRAFRGLKSFHLLRTLSLLG